MSRVTRISSFVLLLSLAIARADPPPQAANAVESYREAMAMMKSISDEDRQRLGLCGSDGCWVVTTPLDPPTIDLLVRQQQAIALVRQAVDIPHADWGPRQGDTERLLEIVNEVPRLSALMVLQARRELSRSQQEQAIDDLMAAMTLARHAGRPGILITKLAEHAAMRPAMDLLAQHLPELPPRILHSLPQRLRQLPPSSTAAQIILGEKQFARAALQRQKAGPAMLRLIDVLDPLYDRASEAASRHPSEFARVLDEELAKVSLNPFAKTIVPSLKRAQEGLAAHAVKGTMLEAAVAVMARGEAALADFHDPVCGSPFTYQKTKSGFELSSELVIREQPVKLTVGGLSPTP
jgi:hypothetical protein